MKKEQEAEITAEEKQHRRLGCKGSRAREYFKSLRSFNHWQFLMTRPFQPYILGICDLAHFMVNKRTWPSAWNNCQKTAIFQQWQLFLPVAPVFARTYIPVPPPTPTFFPSCQKEWFSPIRSLHFSLKWLNSCSCCPWAHTGLGDLSAEHSVGSAAPLHHGPQLLQDHFIASSSKIRGVLGVGPRGGCSNLSFLNVSSIFMRTAKYYQLEN